MTYYDPPEPSEWEDGENWTDPKEDNLKIEDDDGDDKKPKFCF